MDLKFARSAKFLAIYLKWINFHVDKISWIEDLKFSRGLKFANQPVFHLISFIFLRVYAKIAILKISRGQNFAKMAKIRKNRENKSTRKLIHLRVLQCFHKTQEIGEISQNKVFVNNISRTHDGLFQKKTVRPLLRKSISVPRFEWNSTVV